MSKIDKQMQELADEAGMLVYRDPDCRNRYVVVKSADWPDVAELAEEVARPGGMRVGAQFIGPRAMTLGWFYGYAAKKPCSCARIRGEEEFCPECHHTWDDHGFARCRGND